MISLHGALEPRSGWTADACSIGRALDVVHTRTAFLILREAFYGTTRFDDFVARVGVSEPVASARLRELVEEGLLERETYREEGQRARRQYRLTEKGSDLLPVLVALMRWGDKWLDSEPGRSGPVRLRHAGCGSVVETELRCSAGHHVDAQDLELVVNRARD